MRVVVALQHHFRMTPDGIIYPYSVYDHAFWRRYLTVFEEVLVFARVGKTAHAPEHASVANGPRVYFFPLPDFLGPWQYLRRRGKMADLARQVLKPTDACILRVPGHVGTLLWKELIKTQRPYGLEVVGDPWDSLGPGAVKSIFRPIVRRKYRLDLTVQCRLASAASYVTQYSLQRRYPPGGWSNYCSDIELPALLDNSMVQHRIQVIQNKHRSSKAWRLCYVGTMNQLYKAPDVLLKAVAIDIRKGTNLELIMLGDGQYRPHMERQARHLGISQCVQFRGQVAPGQAVIEQLDQSDLFVLPSRQEGLPRTVLEAMARGLPCITSNVGGFPELMEDAYMVRPNDVKGLAERIQQMLSNPQAMREAVRRNVEKAAEYGADVLQKKRVEFYCQVRDITQSWLDKKNP